MALRAIALVARCFPRPGRRSGSTAASAPGLSWFSSPPATSRCGSSRNEPGSPWTTSLHVDDTAPPDAQAALADIFLGRRGGSQILGVPWNRKPSVLRGVSASKIELDHVSERRFLRVADRVVLRISRPVETDQTVTCVIPGHDQPGHELCAEVLSVDDEPYEDEFAGNCAFTSRSSYSSDD